MALTLHHHPLSSFCHKVSIALYELGAPFESVIVDLGDADARAAFLRLSPMGKMPALVDTESGQPLSETSIIIEYLDRRYPGPAPLLPSDPDQALRVRALDRFFDLYVQQPMQKIVGDRLRPAGAKDPHGVDHARAALGDAYDVIERDIPGAGWAAGDAFTMADCAAAPGLFYANKVLPFAETHPATAAYHARLAQRPSVARVLAEAAPYLAMFPA